MACIDKSSILHHPTKPYGQCHQDSTFIRFLKTMVSLLGAGQIDQQNSEPKSRDRNTRITKSGYQIIRPSASPYCGDRAERYTENSADNEGDATQI
jgi:hypothetical protein